MPDTLELVRHALTGRYKVERLLGQGGMATVYLALDQRHNRMVAIKVLRPELSQTIGLDRFSREIGIAARLSHPHIVPLLDSGTLELGSGWPASAYYVMPYVAGESLRDRLNREPKLPLPVALAIAREVAGALDYAHRQGVIHRDIKPENILLSDDHAVVTDFGIARALDEASSGTLTGVGQTIGTPTYMSPEQVTGEGTIDGRADQYALGCMLFEMLAGRPPWTAGNVSALMARRLSGPAPKVRSVDPSVPAAVDETLARALAVKPEERFSTPAEFARALGSEAVSAPRRSRTVRAFLTVAAAAVVVFALTRLARPGRADAITSLAIAPDSAERSVAYLSSGMQESVAELLRRIPQLRITAPSLVAQLRHQQPAMNNLELGERLKVGAVLTWNLQRVGDSVLVDAELLRIPGGSLMWSVRHTRSYADIASMQGELARMISDGLRLPLTGVERATFSQRPTANAAAYDYYLQGRRFVNRAIPLGAAEAQANLDSTYVYGRKAIALDSNFAAPWGLLATAYFVEGFRGWKQPFAAYIDSASVFSQRALALDSTLGDAWVNLVSRGLYLDDDWPAVNDYVSRALRLASHDAQVLVFSSIYVGEVEGKIDSALGLVRRAAEVEPTNASFNTLGDLFMRKRRYDSAVVALRHAVELDSSPPGPRRRLMQSLEILGRYAEAIEQRRLLGDTAGAHAMEKAWKAEGVAGFERERRAALLRRIDTLTAAMSAPRHMPADTVPVLREGRLAQAYAQLGDWPHAMDWIEKEHQRRPKRFILYQMNPDFAPLWNDPRFKALGAKSP